MLKLDADEINFADGVFSSPKTNRTLTIKEVAKDAMEPANLPKGIDAGLIATATYTAPVQNFPNGCHICELEIDEETGEVEIVALQRGRRRRHRHQSAAAERPDRGRRGARASGKS